MKKNIAKSKKLEFDASPAILNKMNEQQKYNLLGQITSLMLASKLHRKYLIDDIATMFLPAIHLNQFRLYKNNKGSVIGIVTWAYLSDEQQEKYQKGQKTLTKLADWKSGKNGWIIDFISPFGHTKKIVQDLKNNIFPNINGKALRIDSTGKIKRISKLHGSKKTKTKKT